MLLQSHIIIIIIYNYYYIPYLLTITKLPSISYTTCNGNDFGADRHFSLLT